MAGKVLNIKVFGPLKLRSGLTGKYHAICHYSYNLPLPPSQIKMRAIILILILSLTISVSFSQESIAELYFIEGKIIALLGIKSYPVTESVIKLTGEQNGLEESNSNGEFRFSDLKSGEYKIKFISSYGELDTIIKIENRDLKDLNIVFISDCEIDAEIANLDLKNKTPRLLIFGGIAPTEVYGQEKFEEKFGVEYYNYGCIAPAYECALEYNQVIFDFLTDKYGKKWRREVRKDVVGIKKKRKARR
jgi:hypothetical protein